MVVHVAAGLCAHALCRLGQVPGSAAGCAAFAEPDQTD